MKLIALTLLVTLIPLISGAAPESLETKSAKGKYTVKFQRTSEAAQSRASVNSANGHELFAFETGMSVAKDSFVWNKSETAVAFAAGTPFLMRCYILFIAETRWTVLEVPAPKQGWDNIYQLPKSWKGEILTLAVDGPHRGKSDGYWFSGTMRVAVKGPGGEARIVAEEIKVEQDTPAEP